MLPWQAQMLLFGDAISPRIGDAIARALTIRVVARLLGMSSGTTYHATLRSETPTPGVLARSPR